MTGKKVNITDIANITGLSITTVSRVLSGKAEQYRIGKKSQQKIRDAAQKLHYMPNLFASNLRTGRSGTIGLIVPSLNNPFFAEITSEINAEVRKYGYITLISDSNEDPEIEKIELGQLMSRNIEGLIIVPCGEQFEHIKSLYDQGLPVIFIDRYFDDLQIPYVSTDNYYGAYTATQQLIEYGHRRITCIQGVKHSTPNRLRVKGFTDAMHDAGLSGFYIVGDDFTVQNGYLETKLLLQQKEQPTAILTLSNTIALGCIKALKEENIRIPRDISLITFDEHPYLDYLATPLSCISQPVSNICKIAVKTLFPMITQGEVRASRVLLKPEVKMKDSVGRIE